MLQVRLLRSGAHARIDNQVKASVKVTRVNLHGPIRQPDNKLLIDKQLIQLDEKAKKLRQSCLCKDTRDKLKTLIALLCNNANARSRLIQAVAVKALIVLRNASAVFFDCVEVFEHVKRPALQLCGWKRLQCFGHITFDTDKLRVVQHVVDINESSCINRHLTVVALRDIVNHLPDNRRFAVLHLRDQIRKSCFWPDVMRFNTW